MKTVLKLILASVLLLTSGCIAWDEGWKTKVQATGQGDVKALLASALALESSADSAEKVLNLITAYEKALAADPANFEALRKLGEFNHLYAYIYATDKKVKEEYYLKSLRYCERAMYTNTKFRALADQGKTVWECVDTLTVNEMEAMFYWYVAAGQLWTECYGSLSHLLNFRFPARGFVVLKRMSDINPDWGDGRIHMAWGAAYAILPGFMGGDEVKSADEFAKGIKAGPDLLVHYFVRARYLDVKKGDKEAFKKDLEYVIAADAKKAGHDYPWNVAYQKKAKELLAQADELF